MPVKELKYRARTQQLSCNSQGWRRKFLEENRRTGRNEKHAGNNRKEDGVFAVAGLFGYQYSSTWRASEGKKEKWASKRKDRMKEGRGPDSNFRGPPPFRRIVDSRYGTPTSTNIVITWGSSDSQSLGHIFS